MHTLRSTLAGFAGAIVLFFAASVASVALDDPSHDSGHLADLSHPASAAAQIVPAPAAGDPATSFSLSIAHHAEESTTATSVCVLTLKLAPPAPGERPSPIAEALVWWVTPSGQRVSIPLRPVEDGLYATRVETPAEPGTHRLNLILLSERPDHTIGGIAEVGYLLAIPQLMLARETERRLNEQGEMTNVAPPAQPIPTVKPASPPEPEPPPSVMTIERPRRAGWSLGVWFLGIWILGLTAAFGTAGYLAFKSRRRSYRERRSNSILPGDAEGGEKNAATEAAAPASLDAAAQAANAAAASGNGVAGATTEIVTPQAAPKPGGAARKSASQEPREIPDSVREANQILAGIIEKSVPGMGEQALAPLRSELEIAETEVRPKASTPAAIIPEAQTQTQTQPAPEAAPEPRSAEAPQAAVALAETAIEENTESLLEPESVSSEELIKSLQMTMEQVQGEPAAAAIRPPAPAAPLVADGADETLDFNNLSF